MTLASATPATLDGAADVARGRRPGRPAGAGRGHPAGRQLRAIGPRPFHRADRVQRGGQDQPLLKVDTRPAWRRPRARSAILRRAAGPRARDSSATYRRRSSLDPDMPVRARDLVGLGLDGHRFGLPLAEAAAPPPAGRRDAPARVDAGRFAPTSRVGKPVRRRAAARVMIAAPRLISSPRPAAARTRPLGQPGTSRKPRRRSSRCWPGVCAERQVAVA